MLNLTGTATIRLSRHPRMRATFSIFTTVGKQHCKTHQYSHKIMFVQNWTLPLVHLKATNTRRCFLNLRVQPLSQSFILTVGPLTYNMH